MTTKVSVGKMGKQTANPAPQRQRASTAGAGSGPIAQLAGTINSSDRVRSLAQLGAEIHSSPRMVGQMGMGAETGVSEPVQAKPKEEKIQTKPKEEKIQAKPQEKLRQHRAANGSSGPASQLKEASGGSSSGLPPGLKTGVESLSGMSMDHVRVHYNSNQPAQLNALAYAQGSEIHVGPGQEQHLPHEAWHVVQQAQNRVPVTAQLKEGVAINDDKALEHEADVMGRKAVTQSMSEPGRPNRTATSDAGDVAQMLMVADDHVRGDLRHRDHAKLFEDYTFDDINTRVPGGDFTNTGMLSNVALDAAVHASRAASMMDYTQLSQQVVSSEKQLTKFLDTKEDDEHMYVLDNDRLHVAIRAEDKKLPHPTLVGGDPDVDCAGTIRKSLDGDVVVTASSGHFRPPSEKPGQDAVDKIMRKTATKSHKKKVKGSKR